MRAIGLMSGTSLDGIDAAFVSVVPRAGSYAVQLERFRTIPFEPDIRGRLLSALAPNVPAPAEVCALDKLLGEAFAVAAQEVAGNEAIDFIASHGLTAYHDGGNGSSLQIGDPYRIREAVGASVVFDFRRADCAAGGQGAPLVPYVDALLFARSDRNVVALNLGGIANVTVLAAGAHASATRAWDIGPGNMLVDAFVRARTNGRYDCDADGTLGLRGRIHDGALQRLMAGEEFFGLEPPKSSGRERFGAHWLAARADVLAGMSLEDGCATLCALTVNAVADSLQIQRVSRPLVVASGGGVHNRALLTQLRKRLAADGGELVLSSDFGVDPDAKEAVAFAVLGYETLRGRPANVPGATGARRATLLGAIAPFELESLLMKLRAELAVNDGA